MDSGSPSRPSGWRALVAVDPGGGVKTPNTSSAALVIANLIPLLGVLFFHWDLFTIMFLFWFENVIVGVYNVLRMAVAVGPGVLGGAVKLFLIPFFCVHYGMFCLVHGVFVVVLFGGGMSTSAGSPGELAGGLLSHSLHPGLLIPVLAIVVSHGISFFVNYIGEGEYKRASAQQLMGRPYGRIVILHVVIIFGGMAAKILGQPMIALVLLVVLKIAIDLAAHRMERGKLGGVSAPA
jgi:hypothetical protein